MDNRLLEFAAMNFKDAAELSGAAQVQRIALGLHQVARAAKGGQRDNGLLQTAAKNFQDAIVLSGAAQVQRIALGLQQFARALKH